MEPIGPSPVSRLIIVVYKAILTPFCRFVPYEITDPYSLTGLKDDANTRNWEKRYFGCCTLPVPFAFTRKYSLIITNLGLK